MAALRSMQRADLTQVNLALSTAFTHAHIEEGFKSWRVPLCTPDFLELYHAANPQGAFVIEKNGRIIAFSFSRVWGQVGWFGPVAVLPEEQGQGLGCTIVSATIEHLKERGLATIGLEMPANSAKNLSFYSKLEFVPQGLVVDMVRRLAGAPLQSNKFEVIRYLSLSQQQRSPFLDSARLLAGQLEEGLDYTTEIEITRTSGFGDTLLLMDRDKPCAMIIGHTEPYSKEEQRAFLKINVLQMLPGAKPLINLQSVLQVLERWANSEGLSAIYIRVPVRYLEVFRFLVAAGFRIVRNEQRLTLAGCPQRDNPQNVNLSKWE